jgi:hypothetical protein
MHLRVIVLSGGVFVLLAGPLATSIAAQQIQPYDLGTLGGSWSLPAGINNQELYQRLWAAHELLRHASRRALARHASRSHARSGPCSCTGTSMTKRPRNARLPTWLRALSRRNPLRPGRSLTPSGRSEIM